MTLAAIYYSRVTTSTDSNGAVTYVIDTSGFDNSLTYKIISYSISGVYTLVSWQITGSDGEGVAGETLWRDDNPVVSTGGHLDLYSDSTRQEYRLIVAQGQSIWTSEIPSTIGNYNVPQSAALALRDPAHITYIP